MTQNLPYSGTRPDFNITEEILGNWAKNQPHTLQIKSTGIAPVLAQPPSDTRAEQQQQCPAGWGRALPRRLSARYG